MKIENLFNCFTLGTQCSNQITSLILKLLKTAVTAFLPRIGTWLQRIAANAIPESTHYYILLVLGLTKAFDKTSVKYYFPKSWIIVLLMVVFFSHGLVLSILFNSQSRSFLRPTERVPLISQKLSICFRLLKLSCFYFNHYKHDKMSGTQRN